VGSYNIYFPGEFPQEKRLKHSTSVAVMTWLKWPACPDWFVGGDQRTILARQSEGREHQFLSITCAGEMVGKTTKRTSRA